MDKFNEWIFAGNTDNGLQTWCKVDTLGDTNYLKFQYRNTEGNVVDVTHTYPVDHVKMLNVLVDICCKEYGKNL